MTKDGDDVNEKERLERLVLAVRDAIDGLDTVSEGDFSRTAGIAVPMVRGGLVSALCDIGEVWPPRSGSGQPLTARQALRGGKAG